MLSLYIHIPFCVRKCLYCGFFSTQYSHELSDQFIQALEREAAAMAGLFRDRAFSTVYIGGGTPTTLTPSQFGQVFRILNTHFRIDVRPEFTVEANPGTITGEKLDALLKAGVNRLSMGMQSFLDRILRVLGRAHTVAEAEASFRLARSAGFQNLSTDLIYGIPGQTAADWQETLGRTIGLGPEHVSAYSLSLDEGSRFAKEAGAGRLALPEDGLVAELYDHAAGQLSWAGFRRYELSNFSLPGFACRHNQNYWDRGEYLGLGPGAWSFVSGARRQTVPDIDAYCRGLEQGMLPTAFEEHTGTDEAAAETLLLGLRTVSGVDLKRFSRQYGQDRLERISRNSEELRRAGLVSVFRGRLRLTERGMTLADELLARLWA